MKISVILQVVVCSTFLSSWAFPGNLKPFYPLIQKASSLNSIDGEYVDTIVTKVKNTRSLVEDQPDIFFEEPIYNFGKVYKNEDVEHVFVFQNHGTKELKIEKIKASCGCIVAETSTRNVPPGMTGIIVTILRSGLNTGHITESISVYSNDPDNPVYALKLSGEIIEDIKINPKQIRFGYVSKGEKAQVEVDIQPRPGFDLEIKDVISSNPVVSIKYRKDELENKYIVEATLKEDTMIGVLTGNIYILTNSERQRRVAISFSGEVLGDIQLYPTHIYFGVIKKGSECVKSIFLTLLKEKIEVEKIEVQPEFLVSEIITEPQKDIGEEEHEILHSDFWEVSTDFPQKKIVGGKKVRLRILTKVRKDTPVGEINGVIKVYTNSKIQPIINIPVSVTITDK
ncbi:MAG: DUF1573 domain-containing protein [Thermodesulfobacteriota bacterium]